MQIQILDGQSAAPFVEPLYQRNGFERVKARASDTFFIAFDQQKEPLGCLRFCVEENTALLRTMAVDEPKRKTGIGKKLLNAYKDYLESHSISNAHLVCSGRLNSFYEQIGFEKIEFSEAPLFLQERMKKYDPELTRITCMKRA